MQLPKNKQRYFTVGLTLAAAAATAHIMQSEGSGRSAVSVNAASAAGLAPTVATPSTSTGNDVTVVAAVGATPVMDQPEEEQLASLEPEMAQDPNPELSNTPQAVSDLPTPPLDVLMPAPLPQPGETLAGRMAGTAMEPKSDLVNAAAEVARNEFGLPCGPILSASAKDMAMVALTLTAPCRGEQVISVSHADLVFSTRLDPLGNASIMVPALQSDAEFAIEFEDEEVVTTFADVPDAENLERVALMFDDAAGLQIHALEFGADYGEEGHVWAEAPRDPASANVLRGGFVTLLGDKTLENPLVAEVYTFPANAANRDGVVRLSVEAEVSALNCAKEVYGQTIERGPDGQPITTALAVSMPECAAIGEFLVLKNLLRDLRIASN